MSETGHTLPPDLEIARIHTHRIGRVLHWVVAIAYTLAVFNLAAAYVFSSWILILGSGIAVLVGLFMHAAARNMHAGNERRGALHITIALIASALAYTIILPGGASSVALLPVIILAVVLPFVKGAALRRSLLACWATGFVLVALNIVWHPATQLPTWFILAIRALAVAAILAFTLNLLTHHHRRLQALADRARADSDALREAHDRLQESDKAKTRFLNSAAHELRTPLTPVLIQLELMQQNPNLKKDERLKHSTRLIDRNVRRLKSHVDDLLDIARMQSGRLRFTPAPVELDALVQDAAETFGEPARAKEIRLVAEPAPGVYLLADGPRVIQVLFNLLSNAIKATPPGGRIRITSETHDATCTVHVKDTGRGIRSEDRDRLFQPFSQIPDEPEPGVGLGLYISRSIIEAQGGTIDCTSEGPGRGTDFSFTLPLAHPQPPGGPEDVPPDQARPAEQEATAGQARETTPRTQTP